MNKRRATLALMGWTALGLSGLAMAQARIEIDVYYNAG